MNKTKQLGKILFFLTCITVQLPVMQAWAQQNDLKRLVFSDSFTHPLDTAVWIVELEPLPGSSVAVHHGKLVLDTRGGATVWLNRRLKGNIRIEYTRRIPIEGKTNDRLSDMNQFWMATDPHNPNLFTRNGKFETYDSLKLYYTGIGGNTNQTTRFRKYTGTGERTLLQEYTDTEHLLKPGHTYHIRIEVQNNTISFFVDGNRYFQYTDPNPLHEGYFGFRTTASRHEIDNIKIYQ